MAKEKKGGKGSKASSQALPSLSPVQQPCGLSNLGNTCYFNSALQLLVACHQLTMPLAGLSPGGGRGSAAGNSKPAGPGSSGPLGFALKQAIMHMYGTIGPPMMASTQGATPSQPSTYNPQALLAAVCRHAPHFKEKQQQHDAHELLHCLLDGLQTEESRLHAYMQKCQRQISADTPPSSTPSTSTPSFPATPIGPSPQYALAQQQHNLAASGVLPPHQQAAHSPLQHSPSSPLHSQGSPTLQSPSPRQLSPLTAPPPSAVEKAFGGLLGSTIACHGCGHTLVSSEPFLDLSLPIPLTHKPPTPTKDRASSDSSRAGDDAQKTGSKKKKTKAPSSEATTLADDAQAEGKKGKKDRQPQQQQQQQQQQQPAVPESRKALPLKLRRKLEAEAKRQAVMDARVSKRKHRQLLDDVEEGGSREGEGEVEGEKQTACVEGQENEGEGGAEVKTSEEEVLKMHEDGCRKGADAYRMGREVQVRGGNLMRREVEEEKEGRLASLFVADGSTGSGREGVELGHEHLIPLQGQPQHQIRAHHGVQETLHSLALRAGGAAGLRGRDIQRGAGADVSCSSACEAESKPCGGQSACRQGWGEPRSRPAYTSTFGPTSTNSGSVGNSSSLESKATDSTAACPHPQNPISAGLQHLLPTDSAGNAAASSSSAANVVVVGFEVPPAAASITASCASTCSHSSSTSGNSRDGCGGVHRGREREGQHSEMGRDRGFSTLLPVSLSSPGTSSAAHRSDSMPAHVNTSAAACVDGGTLPPPPQSPSAPPPPPPPPLQCEPNQQQYALLPLLCSPCSAAADLSLQRQQMQQQQQQEQHLPFTPRSIRTSSHSSLTSLLRGTANSGSSNSSSMVDMLHMGGSNGSAAGGIGHQHHNLHPSPYHGQRQFQQEHCSQDVCLPCLHQQQQQQQQQQHLQAGKQQQQQQQLPSPPLERPLLNGGQGVPEHSSQAQHSPAHTQPLGPHAPQQNAQGTVQNTHPLSPDQEQTAAAAPPGAAGSLLPNVQPAHKQHGSTFDDSHGSIGASGPGSQPQHRHKQQLQLQQPPLTRNSSSHMQLHLLPPQHRPPPRPSPTTSSGCAPMSSAAAGATPPSDAAPYSVPHAPPHLLDCLVAFFQAEPLVWECPRERDLAKKRARARYQFHHPHTHHAHSHPHPTDLLHLTQHSGHGAHFGHHHHSHHHHHHHQEHHSRRVHAAVHASPPPPTSYPHTLVQPSPFASPTPQECPTSSLTYGDRLSADGCMHSPSSAQHAYDQTSQSRTPPSKSESAPDSHCTQAHSPTIAPRSILPSTCQEAPSHPSPDQSQLPFPRQTSSRSPPSLNTTTITTTTTTLPLKQTPTQGPMGSAAPPSLVPWPPPPHHSFTPIHSTPLHLQTHCSPHTPQHLEHCSRPNEPVLGPGMSAGVQHRSAWWPRGDDMHQHHPLQGELGPHMFVQCSHQQQPTLQHLMEPPEDQHHAALTADGPGRKQVSFSPLPPCVFDVPGVEEQRGTHIGAALTGQAVFMRPVRCPLPDPLRPQQENPSRNANSPAELSLPCREGPPAAEHESLSRDASFPAEISMPCHHGPPAHECESPSRNVSSPAELSESCSLGHEAKLGAGQTALQHQSNGKVAQGELQSAPPLQYPHIPSSNSVPFQAELSSTSKPARDAMRASGISDDLGPGEPTQVDGSGRGDAAGQEVYPWQPQLQHHHCQQQQQQQQRRGEAGAYVDDSGVDEDGGVHRGKHEGTVLLLISAKLDPQDLNMLYVNLEAGANQWGTGVARDRQSPCHAVLPGGRPITLTTLDISRAWQHDSKASVRAGGANAHGCPQGDGLQGGSSSAGGDGCDNGENEDLHSPCCQEAPAVVDAVLAAIDCAAQVVEAYGAAAAPTWLLSAQLEGPLEDCVAPPGSAAAPSPQAQQQQQQQQQQQRQQEQQQEWQQEQQQQQQHRCHAGEGSVKQLHLQPSEHGEGSLASGKTSGLPCSIGAATGSCWRLRGRVPIAAAPVAAVTPAAAATTATGAQQQQGPQAQAAEPLRLVHKGQQEQERERAEHPTLLCCHRSPVADDNGGLMGFVSSGGAGLTHGAAGSGDMDGVSALKEWVNPGSTYNIPSESSAETAPATNAFTTGTVAEAAGLQARLSSLALSFPLSKQNGHEWQTGPQARPSSSVLLFPHGQENENEGQGESGNTCTDRPRLRGGAVPLLTRQQERQEQEVEQDVGNRWHGEAPTQDGQQQQLQQQHDGNSSPENAQQQHDGNSSPENAQQQHDGNSSPENAKQQQLLLLPPLQQAPPALPIPPCPPPLIPAHQHYPPSPSPSCSPLLSSPSPGARPPLLSPRAHFPSLTSSSSVACAAPFHCPQSSPAASATTPTPGAGGGGLGMAASSPSPRAAAALSSAASLPPSPLSCMSPKLSSVERQALKRPASKAYHLQGVPPVLLLHLKRFQPGSHGCWRKVDSHVAFDMDLDVSPFVPPPAPAFGPPFSPNAGGATSREGGVPDKIVPPYQLVGVIEHTGSMKAGHYVAYVRRPRSSPIPPNGVHDDGFSSAHTEAETARSSAAAAGQKGGAAGEQATGKRSDPAGKWGNRKHTIGKNGQKGKGAGDECEEGGSGVCSAWFCISDTSVRQVTPAQVLRAQAYVLMYAQSEDANQE